MKVTLRGAVAAALTLTLAFSACQAPNNGAKPNRLENQKVIKTATADWNPQPRENVRDGGEMNFVLSQLPNQLNTYHVDALSDSSTLWGWYNPVLLHYSPEGDPYFDKNYLSKVEDKVEQNKTVVTLTFRKEATYNDGQPIDWRSIETMWKTCGSHNPDWNCRSTDGFDLIESVTKGADDKQAVVTFQTVYPWWKSLFITIMHPKLADMTFFTQGYVNGAAHKELGAGPYRLSAIDIKEGRVVLLPNEKWWGPKPKLDKVVFKLYEDTAALNAFRNGQLDAAGVASQEGLAQVRDLAGIEVRKGSMLKWTVLVLNARQPLLSDINIRKAVMFGIDRKVLADITFKGLEFSEELPGSTLLFPFQKGYRDNFSKVVRYDPAVSNKTLDEAGWKKGGDGIRSKDGKRLELHLPNFVDAASEKAVDAALKQMMKNIGVDLQVEDRPSPDFDDYMKDHKYDIIIPNMDAGSPDGVLSVPQVFASTSNWNPVGIGTPEVDAALDNLVKLPTAEEQIRAANDLEGDAFKIYGIMPLYNGITMVACKKGMANFGAAAFGSPQLEDIGWQS